MRRATITIPDDLEVELNRYLERQPAPPTLATLLQAALRRYLEEEELRRRDYRPARGPLRISAASKGSGVADVAERHDAYLTGDRES